MPLSYYGVNVIELEPLSSSTIEEVVARVIERQRSLAVKQPLISSHVDAAFLASSLLSAAPDVMVALQGQRVVGHLRGTTLENEVFGKSVWINPEGLSYDSSDILAILYSEMGARWMANNATRHFVWVPSDGIDYGPWLELGFSLMHQRGTLMIDSVSSVTLPDGYTVRRGSLRDLDEAIELDQIIQRAQEKGPSFLLNVPTGEQRNEWTETLEDPDVTHLFVENKGTLVAQCATFGLPQRLGSYPETVHLSAVSVRDEHQRRGIARAMVTVALHEARSQGFLYAETNWRVTNRYAAHYWTKFGFSPTYTRLQRRIGTD
jgi:ribosomal protein S18 acetylase RimI-like enzyme